MTKIFWVYVTKMIMFRNSYNSFAYRNLVLMKHRTNQSIKIIYTF